ncbi:MAG: tetratricopeptide repeat protein, partial [Candidatus Obscuribacterales bacterium]|nr:tetratricopeptide repeat protein [Candidatus Obscuribacterales bacterium]
MRAMSRIVVLTLSMLISIPVFMALQSKAAAQSPSPQAISMYNLGLNAFKIGSLESAIIFFKRATDLDPNLADAQYNLGVLFKSQRRFKEALPRFEEVLRIKPNDTEAHYQIGLSLQALSQFVEAKQHYQSIPPSSSNFAEAQKRVFECDARIASPQGGQTNSPAVPPTQSQAIPIAIPNPPPVTSASPPVTAYIPPTTETTPSNSSSTQTQPAPAPQSPSVAGKPIAVLANTSVRVIATGFNAPSGLTFDRQGNLYVANFNSNTVDRISSDGTRSQFASGGHLKGPIGLAADDSGNI